MLRCLESILDPDVEEANPCLRYMLFPGDPDLPNLDSDLKLIWSDIERAISERDEIIFLGYSMPDYDSFTAQFFKQFYSKNIEVYNPSKNIWSDSRLFSGQVSNYLGKLLRILRMGMHQLLSLAVSRAYLNYSIVFVA